MAALVVLCDFYREHLDAETIHKAWLRLERVVRTLPESTRPIAVHHADARALPVESGSATRHRAMTSTDFDTLSAAKRLREAGFNEDQAEAIAEGMREAATADRSDLVTKADLAVLKADLAAVRIEMRIYGITVLAIAGKLFGIFNAVAGVLA